MRGVVAALSTFCDSHGAKVSFCTQSWNSHQRMELILGRNGFDSKSCQACRSLPLTKRYLMSECPEDNVLFASCNYDCIPDEAVQQNLQSISNRCFIVESPRKRFKDEEFFVFSEKTTASLVLAYNFVLPDSQNVRGFKRKYSILVVLCEASHPFELVRVVKNQMKEVVTKLQQDSESCFRHVKDPTTLVDITSKRAIPRPLRNLSEIVDRLDLYTWLHYKFSFILSHVFNFVSELPIYSAVRFPPEMEIPLWGELKAIFPTGLFLQSVITASFQGSLIVLKSRQPKLINGCRRRLRAFTIRDDQVTSSQDLSEYDVNPRVALVDLDQPDVQYSNHTLIPDSCMMLLEKTLQTPHFTGLTKFLLVEKMKHAYNKPPFVPSRS